MAFLIFAAKRQLRRERIFRDRTDALDSLTDKELISRYRFPRRSILEIVDLIQEDIAPPTSRSHAVQAHIQVMVTLRFLSKDDYQSETGDLHGVSKPTACRCIENVCTAICKHMKNIRFPHEQHQLRAIKEDFYTIANFPNVVGAIDGTLIPIQGMAGEDEPLYVCRKGYHALNIQAVCDAKLRFLNINCKFPGSTHDAYILTSSGLPDIMEDLPEGGWLLGDSGYPLRKWLMTPLTNPASPQEQRFNNAHCRTRNTIERAFGVLKARFRCIHKTGGSLPYKPLKCAKIIETAFRLHNKAIEDNVPLIYGGQICNLHHNHNIVNNINRDAVNIRARIVERF